MLHQNQEESRHIDHFKKLRIRILKVWSALNWTSIDQIWFGSYKSPEDSFLFFSFFFGPVRKIIYSNWNNWLQIIATQTDRRTDGATDRQTNTQEGGAEDRQKDINSTLPEVWRRLQDLRPNSSTLFSPPLVLAGAPGEMCVCLCVCRRVMRLSVCASLVLGVSQNVVRLCGAELIELWGKPGFVLQLGHNEREWEREY